MEFLENDDGIVNVSACIFNVLLFPLSVDSANSPANGWGGSGVQRVERPLTVWTVSVPVPLPHLPPPRTWFLQRMRQGLGISLRKGVDSGEPDRGRVSSGLRGIPGPGGSNGEHLKLTPPGLRARAVPKEGHETAPGANVTPPGNSALVLAFAPPPLPSMELVWRAGPVPLYPHSRSPEEVPTEFSHLN